jgi:hypothetical protein
MVSKARKAEKWAEVAILSELWAHPLVCSLNKVTNLAERGNRFPSLLTCQRRRYVILQPFSLTRVSAAAETHLRLALP